MEDKCSLGNLCVVIKKSCKDIWQRNLAKKSGKEIWRRNLAKIFGKNTRPVKKSAKSASAIPSHGGLLHEQKN
jgi:hypothetical protein